MWLKFFNAAKRNSPFAIALHLTCMVVLSTNAFAEGKGVTCVNKQLTEKKYIAVEYINYNSKACKTLYNDGVSPTREIAWARSSTQKCEEVASNLVAKLNRAGMSCSTSPFAKAHPKVYKPTVQPSPENDALLKSIVK